jgi:hypothetical protein
MSMAHKTIPKSLATLAAGALFGFGLSYATMIRPEVVLSFLRFQDFGLMLVMGGAVLVVLLAYQLAPRWLARPLLDDHFHKHPSVWSRDTLVGAALFGVGWGLCAASARDRPLQAWVPATGACSGHWPALRWARWCRGSGRSERPFRHRHGAQFDHVVSHGVGIDDPVQKAVPHTPLDLVTLQGHRLVVQANDLTGALLLIAIQKADHLTDGHFIATQALRFVFPNLYIRAIEVDGGVGDDPTHGVVQVQNDHVLSAHFQHLATLERVGLGVEILHTLADFQAGLHGLEPTRLVQNPVNGGAHSEEFKGGSLVKCFDDVGEIHAGKSFDSPELYIRADGGCIQASHLRFKPEA